MKCYLCIDFAHQVKTLCNLILKDSISTQTPEGLKAQDAGVGHQRTYCASPKVKCTC